MKSNQIIITIVAFLIGVLVAMGITRDKASEPKEETQLEESVEAEANETAQAEVKEETKAPAAAATTTAKATATATKPAPVRASCTPNISGTKDERFNAIKLNWNTCPSDDFQFYKILKSSTSSSLSYPASAVVVSSSNKNLSNHVDKDVLRATTYHYRACVIERPSKVSCGNTISIEY